MRKMNVILVLLIAIAIAVVSVGNAQPMRKFHERGHQKSGPMMFKMLDLSEEQVAQMTDLRVEHQKKMLPIQTEIQQRVGELKLLQTEDRPNLKKIDGKIEEIADLRAELQKERVRHHLKIRDLLTDEQKKMFDSKILTRPGGRKGCDQMRHGKSPRGFSR